MVRESGYLSRWERAGKRLGNACLPAFINYVPAAACVKRNVLQELEQVRILPAGTFLRKEKLTL